MSPVVIKPGTSKPRMSQEPGGFPGTGGNQEEDSFNLRQGFRDWLQVLINPEPCFAKAEGSTGFQAAFSVLLAYMLVLGLAGSYMTLAAEIHWNHLDVVLLGAAFLVMAIYLAVNAVLLAAWSIILHWVSHLCGGRSVYAGTFRTATYAFAPFITLSVIAGLLTLVLYPGQSFKSWQSNPCMLTANLISLVWMALLTVVGLRATQRMTYGSAIGAVVVSCILLGILWGALAVAGVGIGVLTGR